ncbi:hypothetical protein ACFVJ8_12630 [Streptomyces yangpuensis]|uniref:hypothetical protein n=1 Tax=Streptomyces yangpuensis TaxID=1648182 RepID=UPI00363E12FA
MEAALFAVDFFAVGAAVLLVFSAVAFMPVVGSQVASEADAVARPRGRLSTHPFG